MDTPDRPLIEDAYTRFLDAAEQVFTEQGYNGMTIRMIAERSDSNLGTLSQYWGSKRALVREIFERRFRPIQDWRTELFDDLERRIAHGERVSVEEVVRALVEPAFVVPGVPIEEAPHITMLLGRAINDPSEEVVEAIDQIFMPNQQQFVSLLQAIGPKLDAREFYWRCSCCVGAIAFSASLRDRLTRHLDFDETTLNPVLATNVIINFLTAGISAPAAEPAKPARAKAKSRRASARSRR